VTRKQVGIRDVAAAAGVSVTTVSHVLNETPHTRTSEETRERVKEAAVNLGYKPNRLARGLRTHASGMVGLVTEEIAITPYAGRIIQGAQEAAAERGLTLAIINSELNLGPDIDPHLLRALMDRQADGFIYATVYHDEVVAPQEMHASPAVLIGARDRDGDIPSVMPDERTGAESVVDMLLAAGHTRIAYAASSVDVPATRGRLVGYREQMAAAGRYTDRLVVEATPEASGGYEAAMALLNHGMSPAERPTALFCYNDRMAMGAYRAAAELGLSIPRDLSIVGFDDQAPIPYSLYPELTTVALPHYEMGAWAVETLFALVEGKGEYRLLGAHPTLLACPIVNRGSVAGPAPSAEQPVS
jgi:LacI family transcriptional regulator